MNDIQHDAYDDARRVSSDALGILPRDNRNHRKKQRIILDTTHAGRGDRVLEVGCGHGLHANQYAERYDYVGVDLSSGLVDATRNRLPADAAVHQMDATQLAFDSGAFDAVVGTAILHHLDDQAGALREWLRVTRPGGTVTLMEPNYLFPKALVSAHVVPAERAKVGMAPWRVRRRLEALGVPYRHGPRLWTPPWPTRLHDTYDSLDAGVRRLPGLRWLSMMQLIHLEVPK